MILIYTYLKQIKIYILTFIFNFINKNENFIYLLWKIYTYNIKKYLIIFNNNKLLM